MAGSITFTTTHYSTIMWVYNGHQRASTPGAGSSVILNYATDYDSTTTFRVYQYNSSTDIKQYIYATFTWSHDGKSGIDPKESSGYKENTVYTVTVNSLANVGKFTISPFIDGERKGVAKYGLAYMDCFGVRYPAATETPDYYTLENTSIRDNIHHIYLDIRGFAADTGYTEPYKCNDVELTSSKEIKSAGIYKLTATEKVSVYLVGTSKGDGVTGIEPEEAFIKSSGAQTFTAGIDTSTESWTSKHDVTVSNRSYTVSECYKYSKDSVVWEVTKGAGDFVESVSKNKVRYSPYGPINQQEIKATSKKVATGAKKYWLRIDYDANGGKGSVPSTESEEFSSLPTSTLHVKVRSASSLIAPDGKKFKCWSTKAGNKYNEGDLFPLYNNSILYATWELKPVYTNYKVYYDGNLPGKTITDLPATWESGNTTSASAIHTICGKLDEPTKPRTDEGAKFLGWSTNKYATAPMSEYKPGTRITLYSGNPELTLYAIWDAGYGVMGYVNKTQLQAGTINGEIDVLTSAFSGTTWNIVNNTVKFTDAYGAAQAWKPMPNKGYEFDNWDQPAKGTILGITNFKATFRGVSVKIDFNLAGGKIVDGKSAYFKNRVVRHGEPYKNNYESGTLDVMQLPDATMLTKDHYTFKGWEIQEDGESKTVTDDTVVTAVAYHTLKAKWEPIKYKVQFKTNAAHGVFDELELKDLKVTIPETYMPFWENYLFYGWNTTGEGDQILEDDETPAGYTFQPGSKIVYTEELFENEDYTLKLNAKWKKDSPVKVTIKSSDGGKKLAPVRNVYIYNGTAWKEVETWYTHNGTTWKEKVKN